MDQMVNDEAPGAVTRWQRDDFDGKELRIFLKQYISKIDVKECNVDNEIPNLDYRKLDFSIDHCHDQIHTAAFSFLVLR